MMCTSQFSISIGDCFFLKKTETRREREREREQCMYLEGIYLLLIKYLRTEK